MQDQERLPMLVEMRRVPAYAPPFYGPAEREPEETKLPLSQYLWILKRYRWRIGSFIAVSVIGTLIVSSRLTPIYESTATVDVDRQTPAGVVGQDSARMFLNDSDQYLATQIKLVQSDSVLRLVGQALKAVAAAAGFADGGTGVNVESKAVFSAGERSRPKQGFGVPLGQWLEGPVGGWVREVTPSPLLEPGAQPRLRGQNLWTMAAFAGWAQEWRATW
jgi:hypothetical protein